MLVRIGDHRGKEKSSIDICVHILPGVNVTRLELLPGLWLQPSITGRECVRGGGSILTC